MTKRSDRCPADVRTVRVLHFITDLAIGGAEQMLTNLATAPASAPIHHVIVSMTDEGAMVGGLVDAGVEWQTLKMRRGRVSLPAFLRSILLVRRLRPDIVQTWLYHADFLGLLAGRLGGCPRVVWNLRCSDMDLDRYPRLTRILVKLLARLSGLPMAVIANSEAGRRWHAALGYRPRRWAIIGNGVNTDKFHPDPKARSRWRQALGIADDEIVVGMVARYDPMKDHEGFLRAARIAARPGLVFVLAGRGVTAAPSLQRLADDTAGRFCLHPECDDVPGLMAALDIAVLASRFGEGSPNVVIEAMATGLPCVVTDVGDAAAIVGATGLVVLPGHPAKLAASITRLANDEKERWRLGLAARRRVEQHFKLEEAVRAYEEFYLSLVTAKD